MASLGEELRKQRELRQISLREVSDATKINVRFLEALERNDFTHLPGGQFNKGFIRAYSLHIGVDPEKLVDAYMEEIQHQDVESRPEDDEPEPWQPSTRRGATLLLRALIVAVVLGGFGLAAWLLLTQLRGGRTEATPSLPAGGPAAGGATSVRLEGLDRGWTA